MNAINCRNILLYPKQENGEEMLCHVVRQLLNMFSDDQTLHVQAIHKANYKYTALTFGPRAQFCLYVPLFEIKISQYIIHVLRKILSINSHHFFIAMNTGDIYNGDAVFSACLELYFDTYTIWINFRLKDFKHNLVTPSCSTYRT
jgi:hypothetical protein